MKIPALIVFSIPTVKQFIALFSILLEKVSFFGTKVSWMPKNQLQKQKLREKDTIYFPEKIKGQMPISFFSKKFP